MLILIILFGLSAAMLALGIFNMKQSDAESMRIESIMDYTMEYVEGDSEPKKTNSILKRERKYGNILGKTRLDAMSLEAIKADLPLTGDEWFVLKMIIPLFSGAALGLLTSNLVIGFISIFLASLMLRVFVKARIQKRTKAFTNQLNDALGIMSNSLRAGYSFLQSVNSVSREMPDPIAHEFRRLLKELSLGQDADTALRNLISRVDSEDLELIVRAILIQKETGGNLAEILDTISTTIRDRVKIQGEIKTLTAQGRLSGMVVSLMPVFLIGIMYLINPEYISVLFTHPVGRMMLGFAVVNELIGIFLIKQIVSIEV